MQKDKKADFTRLAAARTDGLLEFMRKLGNLSNTSYYEFDEQDISTLFTKIRNATDSCERRFMEMLKKNKAKTQPSSPLKAVEQSPQEPEIEEEEKASLPEETDKSPIIIPPIIGEAGPGGTEITEADMAGEGVPAFLLKK